MSLGNFLSFVFGTPSLVRHNDDPSINLAYWLVEKMHRIIGRRIAPINIISYRLGHSNSKLGAAGVGTRNSQFFTVHTNTQRQTQQLINWSSSKQLSCHRYTCIYLVYIYIYSNDEPTIQTNKPTKKKDNNKQLLFYTEYQTNGRICVVHTHTQIQFSIYILYICRLLMVTS